MTKFIDGPAAGVTLWLKRAPVFLRAVRSTEGAWDALDQIDDTPTTGESIVVYKLHGEPTWCHINARSKHGERQGGIFQGGEYRVVDSQPKDERVRETASWRAWVAEQVGRPIDGATGAIME